MIKIKLLTVISLLYALNTCTGQTSKNDKMKTDSKNNPLICDPVTGACEVPSHSGEEKVSVHHTEKPVKVIYFTDPICSSCWGIEPQLRKLKLEYGNNIEIDYHMGGLLKDWSYNSGGISKPSDVAHHWDEVSVYYDMPIDGDLWLEDPLDSSYPPSIAFKAAQLQDKDKAIIFLREMREMVFLKKKNIAKWEHIATAAKKAGLDVNQLKTDASGKAKTLFEEDLQFARQYGVRGFPTIFFANENGKETVYGSKPYPFYETSVLKLFPEAKKTEYSKDWKSLFKKFPTLTAKEFSELSGTNRKESENILNELVNKGTLLKTDTKNGAIWELK